MSHRYAYVQDGTFGQGSLPKSARRLDTGEWVMGLAAAPAVMREACGWFEIVRPPKPAVDDTQAIDRHVELVAGVPTVVWTVRPKTQAELDAEAAIVNEETLRDQMIVAHAANRVYLDTLADIANAGQRRAQIKALTRQVNGLLRVVGGRFDGTD